MRGGTELLDFDLYTEELKDTIHDLISCEYPQAKRTFKGYNFRCPLCGDSKDTWKTGRGHIFLNKTPFVYYCFNAGCDASDGMAMTNFMKQLHPEYNKAYIKKVVNLNKESAEKKAARKEKLKKNLYVVARTLPQLKNDTRPDITDMPDFIKRNKKKLIDMKSIKDYPVALDFCAQRGIPEEVYTRWLFVDNPKSPINQRVIIPFLNSKGNMYFYQARTIIGEEPKYKNALTEIRPVYNYYESDFSKPVIILEGPIDSLFIENAIAICGVKYDDRMLDVIKDKYFIFDDDEAGKTAALEHLQKKKYVFLWKRFKKDYKIKTADKTDFNDISKRMGNKKFTFKELEPYFTNHIFSKALL
jgi:DNA primase